MENIFLIIKHYGKTYYPWKYVISINVHANDILNGNGWTVLVESVENRSTVSTFNSCNECVGSPTITRPHARLPPSLLCMDAWMTSQ